MKALVCDIDGVVLHGEEPLPGAHRFVRWLVESPRRFLFLTNYPSQTPEELRERFRRGGLDVPAERFYTSAMATAEFLEDQAGDKRKAFVVGEGGLIQALYAAGFTLTETGADFVVLGETRHYNFDMIQTAAALIEAGARFVATNPDVAGPGGRPSCGAFAAPIERITRKKPFYVGKPNAFMMRAALRHLDCHPEQAWIVGDNMETDIIAGIQTGMRTALVLTGVSRREDLGRYAYQPHHVVDGILDVCPLLEAADSRQ